MRARLSGYDPDTPRGRTVFDWLIVGAATAVFVAFAVHAQAPQLEIRYAWALGLTLVMLVFLGGCGLALWRTTRFG